MSMYADYLKEREGKEVVENEDGFAVFQTNGDECYLSDIYVCRHMRNHGVASLLADKVVAIAKERGCKILTGSINPNLSSATTSLKVLLGYGMSLRSSGAGFMIFYKEI